VIVLPYVLRLVVAAATGFDRSIAQAATSLGASGWTVFRRIEHRLILPGVAGGWLIAFISSFDELTMSIRRVGVDATLPIKITPHHRPAAGLGVDRADRADPGAVLVLDRFYGLDRVLSGKT
jgi:putative spermidine/putrescine transport system permease protein